MKTIQELKDYSNKRKTIRFSDFGYQNTRITRLKLKQLKGFITQIENQPLTPDRFEMRVMLEKEIEFRVLCLSLKHVFHIELK
jgi:gamma-glutamylcysteine synthetase